VLGADPVSAAAAVPSLLPWLGQGAQQAAALQASLQAVCLAAASAADERAEQGTTAPQKRHRTGTDTETDGAAAAAASWACPTVAALQSQLCELPQSGAPRWSEGAMRAAAATLEVLRALEAARPGRVEWAPLVAVFEAVAADATAALSAVRAEDVEAVEAEARCWALLVRAVSVLLPAVLLPAESGSPGEGSRGTFIGLIGVAIAEPKFLAASNARPAGARRVAIAWLLVDSCALPRVALLRLTSSSLSSAMIEATLRACTLDIRYFRIPAVIP